MADYCVMGFGLLVLLIGGILWINTFLFLRRAQVTTGTVVGHKSGGGRRLSGNYPIVQFQDANGRTVEFQEKVSVGGIMIEGNTVKVAYDPEDPQRARIKSFFYSHLIPVIASGVGAVMILSGIPMFQGPVSRLVEFLMKLMEKLPWWL